MGGLSGHPNVVDVLQVGVTHSGRPYIVMPFQSLDSLAVAGAARGPDPVGGGHPAGGAAGRRAGVRAPRRHPAPRHQARQHPALRLRRGPAHRLRHRPHRGRLRDGDGRVHRIAVLQRARGAQRAPAHPAVGHLRPRRRAVLDHRGAGRLRAARGRGDHRPVPAHHRPAHPRPARPRRARRAVRGARTRHGQGPRRPPRQRPRRSGASCRRCSATRGSRSRRWRCPWGGGPRTRTPPTPPRSRSSRTVRRGARRTRCRWSSGRGRARWVRAPRGRCRTPPPNPSANPHASANPSSTSSRAPGTEQRPGSQTAATAALSGGKRVDGATVVVGRPGSAGWPVARAALGRHRPRALRPPGRLGADGGPPRSPARRTGRHPARRLRAAEGRARRRRPRRSRRRRIGAAAVCRSSPSVSSWCCWPSLAVVGVLVLRQVGHHHDDGRAAAGHAGGARERVARPARRTPPRASRSRRPSPTAPSG